MGWTSEEIPYNGFWGSIIPGALTLGNGDSSVSGNEVYAAASASSPIKQLYEIYYSWPSWVSEVIDSPISTDIIVAGDIDSWSGREIYVNNNTYDEITEYRKSSGQWVNFDSFGNSVRSMDVGLTRDAQSGNLRGCLYAAKKNGHLVLYQTVSMGWEEVVIDSNEDYKFVRSGENNLGAYAIHNGGNDKIAVWTPIRCNTPGIPNLKLPLDYTQDMGLTPTLQWYDNGSSSYKLNVYTGQSCSGTPIYSVEISGTSRQIPSGKLQNGTWYSWTVTGINSCGPGNPSDCWCFKTACSYYVNVNSLDFDHNGGSYSFNVTTQSACSWTAVPSDSWIHIISGSGTGNGTVSFSVDPNNSINPRSGNISVEGEIVTINQDGKPCTYSLDPGSNLFNSSGGAGSFSVNTMSGCSWTASENYSWIAITSGSSGTGSGTVYYSVDLNAGINSRTGYINAGGQTFTINQAGIACGYSLNPTGDSFGSAGGTGSFTVNTASDCNWTASENEDWLTITSGGSGPGTGTVSYAVDPNNSTDSRTGYIYAGGQTFTVNQDGLDPGAKILVIDLDGNNTSASLMQTAIEANGYNTQYTTAVPQEINPGSYPVTFVCLGIYPSNHVLIAAEGDILKNYLDNGGKLYMEGGDTWHYDTVVLGMNTSVHPYFGIKPLSDGSGDTADVAGIAGTFTEGLNFTYGGENQYMDRIDVADGVTDAFIIWDNQSPYYHNGVARDTGTYKTIGVSFEFGGIPSNQHNNIMGKYLNFFMTGEPSINVTAPNGGETWGLGTPELITWTPFNITGNVKIVLFKNGSMVSTIAFNIPAAQGTYSWDVGKLADGTIVSPDTGYVIRVKSIDDKTYYDDSNGSFTISGLILTSPDGGEDWALGTTKSITWASGGIAGNVKLILFKNGTRIGNIAYNIPASQGSYSWTVGSLLDGPTVSSGTGYVVRVKSIENSSLSDDSDGGFSISDSWP